MKLEADIIEIYQAQWHEAYARLQAAVNESLIVDDIVRAAAHFVAVSDKLKEAKK